MSAPLGSYALMAEDGARFSDYRLALDIDALVMALCDQTHLNSHFIDALIARHAESGCGIVCSSYAGTFGVPTLFAKAHFSELKHLRGDQGARLLFRENSVSSIPFPGGAVDIDTEEEFVMLSGTTQTP